MIIFYLSKIAIALVHPALAFSIFVGKQATLKPKGGNLSKLANFSI
jgi:hypothetical protein